MTPLMFHVKDVSFPEFLWSKDWPKTHPFWKQSRKLVRGLTVVAKFLSPNTEIFSWFRDCLPFGHLCLAAFGGVGVSWYDVFQFFMSKTRKCCLLVYQKLCMICFNPIWHWGGGHDGPPKCFWPLCPNALEEEAETWWLLILIYGPSKKVIFGSLGYPVLPWQRVCQGVLEIFWSYRSICFRITKF